MNEENNDNMKLKLRPMSVRKEVKSSVREIIDDSVTKTVK